MRRVLYTVNVFCIVEIIAKRTAFDRTNIVWPPMPIWCAQTLAKMTEMPFADIGYIPVLRRRGR